MRADLFQRLPQPTAILLLASILDLVPTVHALYRPLPRYDSLPQPTITVAHHVLDVVAWPPRPTSPPLSPFDLRRRQDTDTICGYIGGDVNIPATCGAGSHCVLDPKHSAIGCCPNGQEPCTTGIFTGCVDANSPPQTEVNPYVFTCQGTNVCYKNQFEDGFFQFGCGTASDLATTVVATPSGATATLDRPTESFSFTATPTTLATPITVGSKATTSSTPSSTSSTSSSSTASTTTSATSESPAASTALPTPPEAPTQSAASGGVNVGAVVGGTISGIAVVVAAIALGFWIYKRRHWGNSRKGPGGPPGVNTQYISPMSGPRSGFTPVHQTYDGYERGLPPGAHQGYAAEITGGNGTTTDDIGRAPYSPPSGYHYPGHYAAGYAAAGAAAGATAGVAAGAAGGAALASNYEPEQPAPNREIDDFTKGFHSALGRIGEEDEYRAPSNSSGENGTVSENTAINNGRLNGASTASEIGNNGQNEAISEEEDNAPFHGSRPLWQQNLRTSRGVAWL